jgi:hypothetical protein
MLGIAIIVDLLWFFFISQKWLWKSDDYIDLAPWESKPHKFATTIGIVNFFVKVSVISFERFAEVNFVC